MSQEEKCLVGCGECESDVLNSAVRSGLIRSVFSQNRPIGAIKVATWFGEK